MEKRTQQNTNSEEPVSTFSTTNTVTTEESVPLDLSTTGSNEADIKDSGFRPLTRSERRTLWLKEYGDQDFALQMWIRLVEQQDVEIEMMFQMQGLLVFGVMVNTARYAQFYIDLNEELHRQRDPDTADALREYYTALIPPIDQPEIGPEGLPIVYRQAHMRDVTIMSAGHKVRVPYWRGQIGQIDAFVVGATPGE
ncbi:MAG: hypothetical protein NVS4B7_10680 [Ktedonobacteraceae bacterium]